MDPPHKRADEPVRHQTHQCAPGNLHSHGQSTTTALNHPLKGPAAPSQSAHAGAPTGLSTRVRSPSRCGARSMKPQDESASTYFAVAFIGTIGAWVCRA